MLIIFAPHAQCSDICFSLYWLPVRLYICGSPILLIANMDGFILPLQKVEGVYVRYVNKIHQYALNGGMSMHSLHSSA